VNLSAMSSPPVSSAGLGRNARAPVTVYNLAVGMLSRNVSTSQPLSNESVVTRPSSSDVGSLRTATANHIVTSALIQWLAGMQQNKVSSFAQGPASPVINSPVLEATSSTVMTKQKLMNVNVKVLNSRKLKDCLFTC